MIQFTNKIITNEDFDTVHKFSLDIISDKMSALDQNVKYVEINTAYKITMRYYVVENLL